MASLSTDRNGNRTLQFIAADGKRRSIRLGKLPAKAVATIKMHVEHLNAASIARTVPPDNTSRWIDELRTANAELLRKLERAGLVESQEPTTSAPNTLGAFLDHFISTFSTTVKPGTVVTWRQSRRLALEYFAADTALRAISEGQAIEFRSYLQTRNRIRNGSKALSETTIRRRCKCLSQFFAHAVSLGLIERNPWSTKKIPKSAPQAAQKFYVSDELADRICDKLPNLQWQALFVLARYAGLRIPSEAAGLQWSDVHWDRNRMIIRSPKTERFEHLATREVPLFPRVYAILRELSEESDKGETFVLPMLRHRSGASLRKPLFRAIRLAGATPWEKPFNALRASCDTQLRRHFPSHQVDRWIGHDEATAKSNYLQITDDDFERACSALHFPVQQPAASTGNGEQRASELAGKRRENLGEGGTAQDLELISIGPEGFEKNAHVKAFSLDTPRRAAQSGAVAHSGAISQAISLARSGLPAAAAGEAIAAISCWIHNLAQLHNIEASIDSQSTLCQVVDALVVCGVLSRTQAAQADTMIDFLSACVYGAPGSSQSLSAILESAAVLLQGK